MPFSPGLHLIPPRTAQRKHQKKVSFSTPHPFLTADVRHQFRRTYQTLQMSEPIFNVESLTAFKKIGFIVPSSNVSLEIITTAILTQLPLVSVHYSRISVTTTDVTSGAASQFQTEKLVEVARLLCNSPVEAIVWNGTSESWTGEGYVAGLKIKDEIEAATSILSSTTSLATVEALRLFGHRKIALATPYNQGNNDRLRDYFESCDIEVVSDARLDITVNNRIANVPLERIKSLIRDADHPEAECIVVPCTNFPAAVVVEEMELELGKPIFDSIIVTLWKSLRMIWMEKPIHGWGKLLRSNPVLERLDDVMSDLREKTYGSRTTLRLDCQEWNCNVDRVCAESLKHGVASLRPITSLNQRSLETCKWIQQHGATLIQPDCANSAIKPSRQLMTVYGVRAQMLLPLMDDYDDVVGWISVHYVPSVREWTEREITALYNAGKRVCQILKENQWVDLRTP